jgi:hypothetical protein
MIYGNPSTDHPLTQGDVIDACPLIYWVVEAQSREPVATGSNERVLVLSQACDLANARSSRVQVAVVHEAFSLVEAGILKSQTIRDQIRRHQVFGWYFLPATQNLPEMIVDLRDIHTLPRALLDRLVLDGHRSTSLASPYREHLAQHFAATYSRIALPEPYETRTDV